MKYLFLILLLLQSVINCSYGQIHDTPNYNWPHEASDLEPDPRIIYGKLDNGFRYVFMPNNKLPKHFSIRLHVHAGSLMEDEHERGLAHFLEHMAFKGIKGYPEDKMTQTLQDLGVTSGSHSNAYTNFNETVYKLDFRNNTSQNLEHSLKILAGIADGMLLDETLIKKEIGVILAEKHDGYNTKHKLFCDQIKFIHKGLRTNDRLPIGLESVIKSANAILLKNFYKKWYRPERMTLVIVGDLNYNEVESLINDYFSTFSNLLEAPTEPNLGAMKYKQGLKSRVYKDKELPKTLIELISLQPYQKKIYDKKQKKEDSYKSIAYGILNERMNKLIKQDNAPFTESFSSSTTGYNICTESIISLYCKPQQVIEALTAAENELRRIFEYGFTDKEFAHMKLTMLYLSQFTKDTNESPKTASLIETLLEKTIDENILVNYQAEYKLSKEFLENEANKEDCLEVFKNSWDMENLIIYLSTNSDIEYTEAQLNEAYFASSKMTLEAPKEQEIIQYYFDNIGNEKGTIIDEHYNAYLDCYQYQFSNNLRVNLKQTSFDKNYILYQINFGNGNDEPNPAPGGITGIVNDINTILYNGDIGQLSKKQIDRSISSLAFINLQTNTFVINSSTKPTNFETMLNLIYRYFLEPTYPSDELSHVHLDIGHSYNYLNQTIDGIITSEVNPYLTNGHPNYQLLTQDNPIARSPEEVRNWITDALVNSHMEVSIVGDFNKEEVLESLLKTLGALPNRKAYKQCYKKEQEVSLRKAPVNKVFCHYSTQPQATSLVYWELPDWENDRDFHITYIRAIILTQLLNERIWQIVRLELGESYSPYAQLIFNGKAINAVAHTDAQKTNYLSELLVEIAANLALEGATEDEFNRVMLAKYFDTESYQSTNGYWLHRLTRSQELPYLNIDADFADSYYKQLTLEEINQAAKEYLQPSKALKVMIVPDNHRF